MIHLFFRLQRFVIMIGALFFATECIWGYGSAKVNSIWIEQNANKNGETGIMVHADFNVFGVKGNKIRVTAYFYDQLKNNLTGGVSGYKTTSGQVCSYKFSTPSTDKSRWSDYKLFIPYRAINLSAQRTYFVSIIIRDVDQDVKLTDEKKYESFVYSGKRKSVIQKKEENRVKTTSWREEMGYGMFAIVSKSSNGYQMRTTYRLCPSCRGSVVCKSCGGLGACSVCRGQGYTITPGYGQVVFCSLCNRTGRCRSCNGSKSCFCRKSEYPGYVIGTSSVTDPNGNVVSSSKADYSNHPTISEKKTKSSEDHEYIDLIHFDVPNYAGGSNNTSWCEKCKEWGATHRHERKRIY